jgi:hypothetical protein
MPELYFEDFRDQPSRSPSFSLRSSKASALEQFVPITFLIYSVEVELHDRSKRCANLC